VSAYLLEAVSDGVGLLPRLLIRGRRAGVQLSTQQPQQFTLHTTPLIQQRKRLDLALNIPILKTDQCLGETKRFDPQGDDPPPPPSSKPVTAGKNKFDRVNYSPPLRCRVGKNPFFFLKTQPSGFFGFFWVFWGFLGFLVFFGFFGVFWGFFAQTKGFLGFFQFLRIP
jgi:hypothetical protein